MRIRDVGRGHSLDAPAVVAIEDDGRRRQVIAVGQGALGAPARPGLVLAHPFRHPRVPVGDFVVADALLAGLVRSFAKSIHGFPRPLLRVLIHPQHELEGGLTPIERRAFEELANNCGARRIAVYEGPELADRDINDALFSKLRN
ncbi:rod shape-determining protein [Panacagrimonas perspica]|uniref:rod shape-determining protein n=1 Tax=Panacagrimonas perspica TaxID=381431 RepID=UPI0013C33E30|nr:rod shape-determining protein [Panacagrimonas perspica]